MKKRRKISPEFKSKVALEALQEQQTIQQIALKHQVHPNQVSEWKKALLANAKGVFESGAKKSDDSLKQKLKQDRLFKQIGQLQVEVDFLKEFCDDCNIPIPPHELR